MLFHTYFVIHTYILPLHPILLLYIFFYVARSLTISGVTCRLTYFVSFKIYAVFYKDTEDATFPIFDAFFVCLPAERCTGGRSDSLRLAHGVPGGGRRYNHRPGICWHAIGQSPQPNII